MTSNIALESEDVRWEFRNFDDDKKVYVEVLGELKPVVDVDFDDNHSVIVLKLGECDLCSME